MDSMEVWFEEPIDEPTEILSIPEVRHYFAHDHHDDELGLRSLHERPEALPDAAVRRERPGEGAHRRRRRAP
jgi:hypothetical protein